ASSDGVPRQGVHGSSAHDATQARAPEVREPTALAEQLHGDVAQSVLPVLEEHPGAAEVGLVLREVAVRHVAITRSSRRASISRRTASLGSPVKIFPARGGSFTVSTFATIVGALRRPTFFGSIPSSAHDQCTVT